MRPQPGDQAVGAILQPLYQTRVRRIRSRRRAREQAARLAVFGAAVLIAALYQTGIVGASSRTNAAPPARTAAAIKAARAAPAAPRAAASTRMADDHRTRARIADWVLSAQPLKGRAYAERLAGIVVAESRRAGVSPMVVAATAYVESEFNQASTPCIGVMQIDGPTARSYGRGSGLDALDLRENVRIGALELGRHSVRDGRQVSLRAMWGRYNGCGPTGQYVDRALRVLYRMRRGEADDWRAHLASRGPLWVE